MTTILVVEDDDDLRRILQWGLEAEGFDVACAADGQQAIEAVFRLRPDLVVLDWELPALTGIEVCALLRGAEHSARISVVMVTGRFEADDSRSGFEAAAVAYVTKPFAVDTLADQIRCVLEQTTARGVLTQPQTHALESATPGPENSDRPAGDAVDRSVPAPDARPGGCAPRSRRRLHCRGRNGNEFDTLSSLGSWRFRWTTHHHSRHSESGAADPDTECPVPTTVRSADAGQRRGRTS